MAAEKSLQQPRCSGFQWAGLIWTAQQGPFHKPPEKENLYRALLVNFKAFANKIDRPSEISFGWANRILNPNN